MPSSVGESSFSLQCEWASTAQRLSKLSSAPWAKIELQRAKTIWHMLTIT